MYYVLYVQKPWQYSTRRAWYFDVMSEWASAFDLTNAVPGAFPNAVRQTPTLPEGEYVSDADEVTNWVLGNE